MKNSIEGNTLTLQETLLILNKGVTIGGKSMREHLVTNEARKKVRYFEFVN